MIEIITNNQNILIIIMILIIILGFIITLIPLISKKNKNIVTNYPIKKESLIHDEQLNKDIFELYKKVAIAKSKFNYETLKELLTESLYKEEELYLKNLKTNKQKLIITNIKLQEIKILSITKKDDIENIDIYLHTSQYDYVIDNKKNLVRGTDETEYQVEYKIIIERNKDKYFKIKKLECIGKWIKNN